jgi:hypothetical protein
MDAAMKLEKMLTLHIPNLMSILTILLDNEEVVIGSNQNACFPSEVCPSVPQFIMQVLNGKGENSKWNNRILHKTREVTDKPIPPCSCLQTIDCRI